MMSNLHHRQASHLICAAAVLFNIPLIYTRSFWRWVFPRNQLHWYGQ